MPETIIPPNARVIEWTAHGNDAPYVAQRMYVDSDWHVAAFETARTNEELVGEFGLTAENLVVLASFPEPTLAEIVGDAPAFVAQGKGGKRPVIYWRTARDGWHFAPVDGAVHPSDPDAQVGRNWYEDMLSDYIDLSTVVPLVPLDRREAADREAENA